MNPGVILYLMSRTFLKFGKGRVPRKVVHNLKPPVMELECHEELSETQSEGSMDVETSTGDELDDTLRAWSTLDDVKYDCLDKTLLGHAEFRAWVEKMEQHAALNQVGSGVVGHAVHLFVRYANAVGNPDGARRSWRALTVYRTVAMWIAFKYDNSIFDPTETMALTGKGRDKLVRSEKIFLDRIQFDVSPPRDYVEVLCALTDTTRLYAASMCVVHGFLKVPSAWGNSVMHKHVCAAALMIACEDDAAAVPKGFVESLSAYTCTTTLYLLDLGEYIMESHNKNFDG
mgnify:CR=1 FL=1